MDCDGIEDRLTDVKLIGVAKWQMGIERDIKIIYQNTNVVYKFHNLQHLHGDIRAYGNLDSISAFKFENFFGILKSRLGSGNLPLEQIFGRIHECIDIKNRYKIKLN